MATFSRRSVLAGSGLLAGGLLAGCSGKGSPGSGNSSGGGSGKIVWWDQYLPKAALEKETFAAFHKDGGPEVSYTVYDPDKMGQAVQLAHQSNQMPDVFTLAGLQTSAAILQAGGWFAPIANPETITSRLPKGTVIEGMNSFDGKLYSFPLNSDRQYVCLPWGNKTMLAKADIDPDADQQSWDDFRAKVRKAQQKVGKPGIILPIKLAGRMSEFVQDLVQTAGFPGFGGIETTTGAYRYDHDSYVQALEFLFSFAKDKVMLAASTNLNARTGRARWAAGDAVYFLDGPYCAGVVKTDFTKFKDELTVAQMPTPDGKTPVQTSGPSGGALWISAKTKQLDQVSKLVTLFTSEDFRKKQPDFMDAAPLDLSLVKDSNAYPSYKKVCEWYAKYGFVGPSSVGRNPAVAAVNAAMKPVQPNLGTIAQGVLTGDVTDIPKALKTYNEGLTKSRDMAIKAKGGGKVSVDDWAFPDWQRGKDYVAS